MPRCVTIGSSTVGQASRSLARKVLTWVSTVQSAASLWSPQTLTKSCSRARMRPRLRNSARSRPYSRRVSGRGTPAKVMHCPASSSTKSVTGAGGMAARLSSARTRAASSRGLKGLGT